MEGRIVATASLVIERAPEDVSAQYADMDHHIRNNVHSGIKLEWLQAEPGQRKIKTTFRILGIPQEDIAYLENEADGTFVIRTVEGTNAGMKVFHRFVDLGNGTTRVDLTADAPATLARKLLGPLFVAGARQVLKKALVEDKADLEGSRFKRGLAAGNVEHALAPLASMADSDVSARRAVLEAACAVSVADGEVDPGERDALRRLAKAIGAEGEISWAEERMTALAKLSTTPGILTEAERIGAVLAQNGVGRAGVIAGAVLGLMSEGLSLGELSVLRSIASKAGVPEEDVGPIVEAADSSLSSVRG